MDDDEYEADLVADQQRKSEPPPSLDREEFLSWRSPRVAEGGPVGLDNQLWHWMVRTRHSGFGANEIFKGPSPFDAGPMWCFDRFGKSETALPDGRIVHIGGEHEDSYDPDFFIYNDVVVIQPDGEISIHGYGRETFPPTDFHSATLVEGAIFVLGCLGYPEQRVAGRTPVFRLSLDTLDMSPVTTSGEGPGWIYKHSATLAEDGRTLIVSGGEVWLSGERSSQENVDQWSLDVETGLWTRLTRLDWQHWTMRRVDKKRNRLWDTRQELWRRDHGWSGMESYWRHDEAPDFEAIESLYRLDADSSPPEEGDKHNIFVVRIDGVRVRFTEDGWTVQAMVEGQLTDARLHELQRVTLATLGRIENADWEIALEPR